MVYRDNAGRLGAGFISVSLETRWLGQKVVSMSQNAAVVYRGVYCPLPNNTSSWLWSDPVGARQLRAPSSRASDPRYCPGSTQFPSGGFKLWIQKPEKTNHLQKHPGLECVDLRLNEGNPTQCNRELVGRTVSQVSSFSGARTGAVNCLCRSPRVLCVFVGKFLYYKSSALY